MLISRHSPLSHNSEMFTKTSVFICKKFISSLFFSSLTPSLNAYSFIHQNYFWLLIVNFVHYGIISNPNLLNRLKIPFKFLDTDYQQCL